MAIWRLIHFFDEWNLIIFVPVFQFIYFCLHFLQLVLLLLQLFFCCKKCFQRSFIACVKLLYRKRPIYFSENIRDRLLSELAVFDIPKRRRNFFLYMLRNKIFAAAEDILTQFLITFDSAARCASEIRACVMPQEEADKGCS